MPSASPAPSFQALTKVIERHWGFRSLRPHQEQAMRAALDGRDSLVVMPTGGGKSLCYQAPAMLRGDTTVVVSPLIALMKDQVDSLRQCGVPAIQLDSSQSTNERYSYEQDVLQGAYRLLFVSPERIVLPDFQQFLHKINVQSFAIDEAHCISHWGHDFRPDYRQLRLLKQQFPRAAVHAFTATATERVRKDIVAQLSLRDPVVLVGNFDRPNLTYRVLPRQDLVEQVEEVLGRHKGEAGIIYCIRRSDVDDLAERLVKRGHKAMPYHAGMTPQDRRKSQDAFAAEACNVIVATVAFGMGINRTNLRFILHTGMPKSVEHYQQETGRAGRDGLEAECVLLHSGEDFMTWKFLISKGASEPGADPAHLPVALKHLEDMEQYARGALCRHRALVQYFGQEYEAGMCAACDICLGDAEEVADALTVAQKILSCVARVKERFGAGHIVAILHGDNTEGVRKWSHEQLTTYGIMKEANKADIRDWIYQLVGQGALDREEIQVGQGGTASILKLNAASWEIMKKQRSVRLMQPVRRQKGERPTRSKVDAKSWEGVDTDLFELLRELRRELAGGRGVPSYVIFSDATLRDMARQKPRSLEQLRLVYGVGDMKLRDFGPRFLEAILEHVGPESPGPPARARPRIPEEPRAPRPSRQEAREQIFELFREGTAIDDVMHQTKKPRSRVRDLLCEFLELEKPTDLSPWISRDLYDQIARAARKVGMERLKPIHAELGEEVTYEDIRLVVTHLHTQAGRG